MTSQITSKATKKPTTTTKKTTTTPKKTKKTTTPIATKLNTPKKKIKKTKKTTTLKQHASEPELPDSLKQNLMQMNRIEAERSTVNTYQEIDSLEKKVEVFAKIFKYDEEYPGARDNILSKDFVEACGEGENNGFEDDEYIEYSYGTNKQEDDEKRKKIVQKYKINVDKNNISFDQVVGLNACKNLLVNVIGKPFLFPQYYKETTQLSKFAYMYGLDGVGKRTLMHAFARRYGLRLVVINGSIDMPQMMKDVLLYSRNYNTIIFFDKCQHFFVNDPPSMYAREFFYIYKDQDIQKYNIWTVFGFSINELPCCTYLKSKVNGNVRHAETQRPLERYILINRLLQSIYREISFNNLGDKYDNLVNRIVNASENMTAGVIEKYIENVFIHKRNILGIKQMQKYNTHSIELLPTYDNFVERLTVVQGRECISELHRKYSNAEVEFFKHRSQSISKYPPKPIKTDQNKTKTADIFQSLGKHSITPPKSVKNKNSFTLVESKF